MKNSFEKSDLKLEGKKSREEFLLTLTPAQKEDLIGIINYYLSEPVGSKYGSRLNDLFKKLTGKNHANWSQ